MEKTVKILIVDDDPKLRKTLSDILKVKGYTTIDVANGKTALNKAESEAPSVALIDLKLTDISGIEVMKGIKKLSPETECIILTGYSSRETAVEAVNLGAFNYMDKPYDMEKLLLIIQRAVEKGESEKALRESEEKWRGLFENSIEAAFTVDLKGNFTSINSALASVMGYKKKEIVGRNYTEFAPREVIDAVFEAYNRLYHTGEPIREFVYKTTRKSGEARTVETYVNTIRKGGEIVGFQGTLRDITEQKRSEEALKKSEEKFRTVADFTYDWEYWRGIDDRFIYTSPSVERITGYSLKEIFDDPKFIEKIVHPDDKHLLEKHRRVLIDDSKECSLKFRIITKDGETRWIGHVCQPVYDSDGNHLGRRGSNRDITKQKLAEDHIINLNRLLKSIRDINQLIVREKDRDNLLQEACDILTSVGGYRMAWVGFVDEGKKKVVPAAQSGFEEGYLDKITITWDEKSTGKGPGGTAIKTKRPCVFNDITNNPKFKPWKSQAEERGYRSCASFPFIYNDIVYYIFCVYSDFKDFFNDEEVELLKEVSQDLAFALSAIETEQERKKAVEELSRSEERYRSLVENLNDVIFNVDMDGIFSYISPAIENISKYSVDDVEGVSFTSFVHPEDLFMLEDVLKLKDADIKEVYEFRVFDKDGEVRHVRVSSRMKMEGKKPVGLTGLMTDITERKKAEEALRESETKYRQLVEGATVGIAIGQDGILKFINPAISELFGRSEEELISKQFTEFLHPDDKDRALRTHYERIKGGEVPYLTGYRIIDSKGDTKWVEVNGVATTWEGKAAALNFITDITERKAAEVALKESEERYRILFESSPVGIGMTDVEGNIYASNPVFEEMVGYSGDEMKGVKLGSIYVNQDDRKELLRRLKEFGYVKEFETTLKKRDGKAFVALLDAQLMEMDGRQVILTTIRDVTHFKEAADALKESEERFRIAAESSSDLIYEWDIATDSLNWYGDIDVALGYKKGEFERTLDAWLKSIHPDDRERLEKIVEDHRKTGEPISVEYRVVKKDGSWRYWMDQGTAMVDKAGKPVKLIGACIDITERKVAEDALRESEERYKSLVENLNDAIFNLDKEGKISYLSPVVETISDYKVEDLMGRPFIELVHPDDLEGLMNSYQKTATGRYEPHEFRVLKKDGTSLHVNTSSRLILEDGEVIGMSGVLTDITERKRAEETLIDEKEKAKIYLDTAGVILIALNRKGEITLLNKKGHEILGYEEGEIVGKNWFRTCLPKGIRGEVESVFKMLMSGDVEPVKYYENPILTKSGEERIIAWHNTILMGREGEIVGTLGSGEDITERKRAEENLIENTLYFRSLIDTLHEDIIVIDGDLRVTDINSSFLKKTGRARDDILGRPCYEVYRGYDDECTSLGNFCPHRIVFKTGENVQVVHEHKKGDGTIQYIDILASPLKDNTGEVVKVIEAMRDVTDIYRAHERIRESEEKFRSFFETSRDVVYLSNVDGKFEDINRSGEKLFGYQRGELLSMDIRKLYQNPEERIAFVKSIEENGFVKDYEVTLKKKDGTKIDSLITAAVRFDKDNKVIGYQGIIRDITERKKLETKLIQTEKLSSLGGILSGVAHELNNPLTSIIGNAQLLARKNLPSDIMNKLEVIQKESFRCTKIVGGLLSFAREHKPERKMIYINDVLRESYKLREYEMRMNGIDFEMELTEDIPRTSADPYQFQQVFINLINNAYDALKNDKGGSLVVRSLCRDNNIVLEFEDDGPGIPAKDLNSIFDPFFTTKEVGEGTGLGLSIVYGIIKEHNGEIRVESVPGEGAKFIIELPVVDELSGEDGVKDQETVKRHGGGKAVLIVEDENSLRDLILDALLYEGYNANACGSVEQAIELMADNRYDAVISDMKMPGLSGKDLYGFIKKKYPSLLKKMLFITGDVLGRETQDFLKDTGVEYVEKPFIIDELLNRVLKLSKDF
ncbi:MAG: PAS domain S-box protein [Deltaproteobacteria bacterium]|uniref:histidine kinase n=1 Tax=Candidatus Zymogenus saltonus TaxID=2844893 RepID=A0A9D8KHJ3_9DELT|nr:PAS domain S-box protein [Candidatus Zymogenus saltonus]